MFIMRLLVMILALGVVAPSFVMAEEGTNVSRELASKKKKKAKKAAKKKAAKKAAKNKRKKKASHAPKGNPTSQDLAPKSGDLPMQEQGDDLPKPSSEE